MRHRVRRPGRVGDCIETPPMFTTSRSIMKIAAAATLAYGLMVLAGGIFGYIQAKSLPSLITGGICGVILLVAGGYIWQGNMPAAYVAGAMTLLLALFFAYRFSTTGNFMPGGLMLALSFVAIVILLYGVFRSLMQHG